MAAAALAAAAAVTRFMYADPTHTSVTGYGWCLGFQISKVETYSNNRCADSVWQLYDACIRILDTEKAGPRTMPPLRNPMGRINIGYRSTLMSIDYLQ